MKVKLYVCVFIGIGAVISRDVALAQSSIAPQVDPITSPVEYIARALQNHPSIRSAQMQVQSGKSEVQGARWQFWPTPSISAERVNTRDPAYAGGDDHAIIVRLQQPLWTGGRLAAGLARSEARALEAHADFKEVQQKLALQVIQAWSEAVVANEKLEAYEGSLSTHGRLLALVQRRVAEGVSSIADVDLAHSRRDGILAEAATVRSQLETALGKLNLLTFSTVSRERLAKTQDQVILVMNGVLDDLIQAARAESPQISKARAQIELAHAEVQIAKSALSPEVFVRAERQIGSYTNAGLPSQNRVFIGLTSSLGGGLSSLSGVQAADAHYKAAVDALQYQELAVEDQIQGDLTLVRNALQRQQSLQRAKKSAVEVSVSWERQFLAGRKQWQELMNVAREQLQAETQLIDAQGAIQLASLRLQVLTQGVESLLGATPIGTSPITLKKN